MAFGIDDAAIAFAASVPGSTEDVVRVNGLEVTDVPVRIQNIE